MCSQKKEITHLFRKSLCIRMRILSLTRKLDSKRNLVGLSTRNRVIARKVAAHLSNLAFLIRVLACHAGCYTSCLSTRAIALTDVSVPSSEHASQKNKKSKGKLGALRSMKQYPYCFMGLLYFLALRRLHPTPKMKREASCTFFALENACYADRVPARATGEEVVISV
jgi:hypothetical protein